MNNNFKSKSFKFVYWIMIIILAGDTLDTIYRFIIIGYFGDGTSLPGVTSIIKPNTFDLAVFIIIQVGVIYGIYLLYNLKRIGGYWFFSSNLIYLIYASIFGPIAEIGILNILTPILLFFCLYLVLAIFIPFLYSDQFE